GYPHGDLRLPRPPRDAGDSCGPNPLLYSSLLPVRPTSGVELWSRTRHLRRDESPDRQKHLGHDLCESCLLDDLRPWLLNTFAASVGEVNGHIHAFWTDFFGGNLQDAIEVSRIADGLDGAKPFEVEGCVCQ